MARFVPVVLAMLLATASYSVFSQEAADKPAEPEQPATPVDHRQLVTMPEQSLQFMRQDMLDHMAALNEVMGLLADSKLTEAADVAEARIGKSSMGKYRATGMGPGRFMPLEMRNIGWSMHEAASEFALIAREGDKDKAYAALQKVMGACVACHYSYRTR